LSTSNKELATVNSKPETHMEVHHHPNVEKKNFKEYFLEFLMIFLAVTMGFFAENLRENVTDSYKTHQFAQSLVQDIKIDVQECDEVQSSMEEHVKIYDSLLAYMAAAGPIWTNKTYYLFCKTSDWNYFQPDNKTIDQLKSTGSLRLFETDDGSDTIASYYQSSSNLIDYGNTFKKIFDEYHSLAMQVFDYSQVRDMIYQPTKLLDSSLHLELLTDDKKVIKRAYNELFVLRLISVDYINDVKSLKKRGISCANFLKKQYDIKN
jgi:hypothetical protein